MVPSKSETTEMTDLKHYRAIEARFYGELMKLCRRYGAELNPISIFGIMDIVKTELRELDKQARQVMKHKKTSLEDESESV